MEGGDAKPFTAKAKPPKEKAEALAAAAGVAGDAEDGAGAPKPPNADELKANGAEAAPVDPNAGAAVVEPNAGAAAEIPNAEALPNAGAAAVDPNAGADAADPKAGVEEPKPGAGLRLNGADDEDGLESDKAGKAAGMEGVPVLTGAKDVPKGDDELLADRDKAGAKESAELLAEDVVGAEKDREGTELAPEPADKPPEAGAPNGDEAGFGGDREAPKAAPKPKAVGAVAALDESPPTAN